MRRAKIGLAGAGAVLCALFAWGALQNLWGGGDSPMATYIVISALWILLACACLAAGIRWARQH